MLENAIHDVSVLYTLILLSGGVDNLLSVVRKLQRVWKFSKLESIRFYLVPLVGGVAPADF